MSGAAITQSTIEFDGELHTIPGYRVKGLLGRGGMATVYLAEQLNLCRDVALKVMAPQFAATPGFAERFLAEGRMTARLNHPNIVTVHDVGQHLGLYYLAAELLPGGTLKERTSSLRSTADKLRVLRGIARGLGYAHDHKIVHRDVKPVNIMFRDETQPVVTDFGIAKSLEASHVFTQAGGVVGTPHYMSPEQAQGLALDGRSDLYALGIMMYQLFVGNVPFDADDPMAILYLHVHQTPPPLPSEYATLQPILDRLLAKLPAQRFQSCAEFAIELEPFLGKRKTGSVADSMGAPNTLVVPERAAEVREQKEGSNRVVPAVRIVAASDLQREPGWIASKDESFLINILESDSSTRLQAAPKQAQKILALAISALVLASAWYLWPPHFNQAAPPFASTEESIRSELLEAVRGYIARGALIQPPDDCALALVNRMLEQAPTDATVLSLLKEIGSTLSVQVRERWDAGQRAEALMLLRIGLDKLPNDLDLNRVRADFQLALDKTENSNPSMPLPASTDDVAELLARAEALFDQSQWTAPEGDNAVEVLHRVLILQPKHARATELLAKIANGYEKVALTWRDRGRPDQALAQVRNGLKAQPTSARLLRLEQQLR